MGLEHQNVICIRPMRNNLQLCSRTICLAHIIIVFHVSALNNAFLFDQHNQVS